MKRALLVTYYFPPAGGVSAQRVLKFAQYLPDFGYLPTVLTVDPRYAAYPALDDTLHDYVPETATVVRTKSWDPFTLYARLQGKSKDDIVGIGFVKENQDRLVSRMGRWIRGNVFLPDARVGWTPFALRAAKQILQQQQPDIVLTTGPPHSIHRVGKQLQKRYAIPWVADFRDPWTDYFFNAHMLQTRAAQAATARMEQRVLSQTDAVVAVSPSIGVAFHQKAALRRYETIPNGFDPEDHSSEPGKRTSGDGRFVIAHVGTLTSEQHASGLLEALSRLDSTAELHFVGHVADRILQAAADAGLSDRLHVRPFVPHAEAIAVMHAADVLLVSTGVGPRTKGIVTGKVFEYLGTGKPILGLGPPEGDLAALLHETGGGRLYRPDDTAAIEGYLRGLINGSIHIAADKDVLVPYTRQALTERLAALFDSLVA